MTRYAFITLILLFTASTAAFANQGAGTTTNTADTPNTSTELNAGVTDDAQADTQPSANAGADDNKSVFDKAGDFISNTGNAAMEMGSKALHASGQTAAKIGDAAVRAGHAALDTSSKAITSASDAVTGALGLDSEKASDTQEKQSSQPDETKPTE